MTNDVLYTIQFQLKQVDVDLISECLTGWEFEFSVNHKPEDEWDVLKVFFLSAEERDANIENVKNIFTNLTDILEAEPKNLTTSQVLKEDWSESWKKYFHPFRASTRIVVKPTWEEYENKDNDLIVELDPGMCFGTGYHGTTKACLQFLDELEEKLGSSSFLEAGCGSGILSIAASKLGYAPIAAFDHDPQASQTAKENLEQAGITNITPTTSDVGEYDNNTKYRVVAANILAHVLMENAEHIVSLIDNSDNKPGYLLLAGSLTEQYPALKERYEALGVKEVKSTTIDEWTSGYYILVG